MYTNLKHDRLVAGGRRVVTDAHECQEHRLQVHHIYKLTLKWDSPGRGATSISADGTYRSKTLWRLPSRWLWHPRLLYRVRPLRQRERE